MLLIIDSKEVHVGFKVVQYSESEIIMWNLYLNKHNVRGWANEIKY